MCFKADYSRLISLLQSWNRSLKILFSESLNISSSFGIGCHGLPVDFCVIRGNGERGRGSNGEGKKKRKRWSERMRIVDGKRWCIHTPHEGHSHNLHVKVAHSRRWATLHHHGMHNAYLNPCIPFYAHMTRHADVTDKCVESLNIFVWTYYPQGIIIKQQRQWTCSRHAGQRMGYYAI